MRSPFAQPTRHASARALHIFTGEAAAAAYRKAGGDGEVMVWRDSMTTGCTPKTRLEKWIRVRAAHLARAHNLDRAWMAAQLLRQIRVLHGYRRYEEITVWVGRDLFCQVTLLYLLAYFATRDLGQTRILLVCPPETGSARMPCIAALHGETLLALHARRRQVTPVELRVAYSAWQVYCSEDPSLINNALRSEMISILELDRLFKLHCQRYPDLATGLGRVERAVLDAIAEGASTPHALLRALLRQRPEYGWGPAQIEAELGALRAGRHALVSSGHELHLTSAGERVLLGRADRVALSGIDLWLGGVHLRSRKHWRFDSSRKALVAA